MRFTTISGLSEIRRLPRVGKIHLGVKETSKKTGNEYPRDVDHFVFDAESPFYGPLVERYGKTPKALPVVFASEDVAQFFPQALKYYGREKGLICTGDGQEAKRMEGVPLGASLKDLKIEGRPEMTEIECPYEECPDYVAGKCRRMGNLAVLLPEITLAGVWQIDTSSYHSIVDLNSSILYVKQVVGRVGMLFDPRTHKPFLTLRRVAKETHGSGRKEIHWPMIVELNVNLADIQAFTRGMPALAPVELPTPAREDDLIPRTVRETLPAPVKDEPPAPAKPNGRDREPVPAGAIEEKPKPAQPTQQTAPANAKPAQRKLSLF